MDTMTPEHDLARKLMHGWSRAHDGQEFPWTQEEWVRTAAREFAQVHEWRWIAELDDGSVLLRVEDGIFVSGRASDSDVAFEYLGTLGGATYSETWNERGDLILQFDDDRIEAVEMTLRPTRVAEHAEMRRHFRDATRLA